MLRKTGTTLCCPVHFKPRVCRSMATVLGSSPNARDATDPAGYCKDLVQKYDYESFLTAPFYPRELQSGYFALKAFYVSHSLVLSFI